MLVYECYSKECSHARQVTVEASPEAVTREQS